MDRLREALQRLSGVLGPAAGSALGRVVGAGAVGAVGLAYGGSSCLFNVEGGHRAVMYHRLGGVQQAIKAEGTHILIPWFMRPIIYDVRAKPRMIQSMTGSKDLQMVNITLRVLSKPNIDELPYIYKRLGHDYDDRVLPSIVNEVTKAVVACYNASELLTKREQVSNEIRHRLVVRAADFRIVLDDVSITHLSFSHEYTAAVEAKQVAQQDAERARYIVEKAIQEKKSIIVKAEGEAQAAKLVGEAISNNPGFIKLRKIDTAKEIATTVSRMQGKVFLDSSSLLINVLGDENLAATEGTNTKAGWFKK